MTQKYNTEISNLNDLHKDEMLKKQKSLQTEEEKMEREFKVKNSKLSEQLKADERKVEALEKSLS